MRLCALLVVVAFVPILGAQPTVRFDRENMRLRSATVTAQGNAFNLALAMENDNGTADGVLPSSYRRWWHCEIGGLRTSGETLNITIDRAGYSDVILPVWALSTDGVTFAAYQRAPTSATPTVAGSQHRFTLQTPAGVRALRLAKFFPYTVTQNDAWLQSLTGRPGIRGRATLGLSRQGRPIQMLELTDASVPDTQKHRVWVHAAVHPAETTANFVAEGLVEFLLSGDPLAELMLDRLIVDVVPMANPDGAFLGNYRTNADSVNLEEQWARPYASTVPEIVALRSRIEQLMGTVAAPASNPIEIVLNLHSSHGVSYPFHFQHTANPGFDLNGSNSGVLPIVNQLEGQWIAAFRGRSAFVQRGATQSSSCGAPVRPFVECMMHDRWSSLSQWTGPGQRPVMAITYEGTYGRGPDGVTWATDDDYRRNGAELGRALADFYGLELDATLSAYGTDCNGPHLAGVVTGGNSVTVRFDYQHADLGAAALLLFGQDQQTIPLPQSACLLRTTPAIQLFLARDAQGRASLSVPMPLVPGFRANAQGVSWSPTAGFGSTAGIEVRANF